MNPLTSHSIAIFIALASGLSGPVAHEFDDGFVERTLSVVIRDQTAYCEYAFGMNDATLRDILTEWDGSPPITHLATTGDQIQSEPPPKVDTSKNTDSEAKPTDDVIDSRLLERLKKTAPAAITRRLKITCNGQTPKLLAVSVAPAPRHPFCILVKFEFKIPESASVKVKISDSNFQKQTGAFRGAIKAVGNTALLRSNSAPILIRATRIELEGLSSTDREKKTNISARIAVLKE